MPIFANTIKNINATIFFPVPGRLRTVIDFYAGGIERMNFNEMTGMISNLMLQNYKIKTINYSI